MHRVGDEVGLGVCGYTDTVERETFIAEKVRNKCQLCLQGQTDGRCFSAQFMHQCVFLSLLTFGSSKNESHELTLHKTMFLPQTLL